jgi:hypothetical protein
LSQIDEIQYIGLFLTLDCNFRCSYCLNHHHQKLLKGKLRSASEWVPFINQAYEKFKLPITLQGGEPSIHRDFYKILTEVDQSVDFDLLTNLNFNVDEFIRRVDVGHFNRTAPYAPIRVSYHHEYTDEAKILLNIQKLEDSGFRVGVYGIDIPNERIFKKINKFKRKCEKLGIDFRFKEYLGKWEDKIYGTFKYQNSVESNSFAQCECKTTEILISPDGGIFRCHADLYQGRSRIGDIDNFESNKLMEFRNCDFYGDCHPCDVKVKTNHLQIFGHTSVLIKEIQESL